MKIKTFYFHNAGPFAENEIDLVDEWTGSIAEKVLFSGPNGSGKSSILRLAAMLWSAAGHWLDKRKLIYRRSPEWKWLKRYGGVAVVLAELPFIPDGDGLGSSSNERLLGLFCGDADWQEGLAKEHPDITWFGESIRGAGSRRTLIQPDKDIMDAWSAARKSLILTSESAKFPNVVHLDAEERRWIPPSRNIGVPVPDDPNLRWLAAYSAGEDWKGQLEASLINLKIVESEKRYRDVIGDLNRFLTGKEIGFKVDPVENRLRVNVTRPRSSWHYLDELSAGEHQVLILVYLLIRRLEKGGVALIDEPDLHIHPSLISGLLSRIEGITRERNGQLIITSHIPEIWDRYETSGIRVSLGGAS